MSREVRRVPADWQHPVDECGWHIPLSEYFVYDDAEIIEGIAEGDLDPDLPNYGTPMMPNWPEEQRTHYQMYNTTSEGTPISPPMESPEALARWLVDNNASVFASQTASYETWLYLCKGGYAPSFVIMNGMGMPGAEFMASKNNS